MGWEKERRDGEREREKEIGSREERGLPTPLFDTLRPVYISWIRRYSSFPARVATTVFILFCSTLSDLVREMPCWAFGGGGGARIKRWGAEPSFLLLAVRAFPDDK